MIIVLTACQNKPEALKIARSLLKKRLIACANYWPIESDYWWNGKLQHATECLLSCKALERNWKKIGKEIQQMHSYELPIIDCVSVKANARALEWVRKESR